MKIRVLILCPPPTSKGGVADYNRLIRSYFCSDRMILDYHHTGNECGDKALCKIVDKCLRDLLAIVRMVPRYDLVILNPSLDAKAVVRDGVYHFFAKTIFRKKTIVVFHGWIPEFEKLIERYGKRLFRVSFNFDKGLVLASQFKRTLVRWGFDPEVVSLETTIYEDHRSDVKKDRFKIVFLSRLTKGKGCLEAIQTVEMVVREFPHVKLYMVGEGELSGQLKEYVVSHHLDGNIEFTGWLEGEEKHRVLNQCGIMLFPTSYGEGMPISLLEGMGAGMAIVTRPAGGIPDIFENGENGFLVTSRDPADFSVKVKLLLDDPDLWQAISMKNIEKARERFEIKNVVKRLEQIYYATAVSPSR